MAGLVPATHEHPMVGGWARWACREPSIAESMDGRDKPDHDDLKD
jgi:hypothetical protein